MKYTLRFLITTLFIPFLSFAALAQNTSPINVIEFNKIQNGIMDEGKLQKNQLEDYDNNPVCLVKVKSQGFDEATLQKLIFVPKNIMIMHKAYENGEYRLYVSSKKPGSIVIKYQGDCEFKLPYNLEPKKIYELVLGMETATLNIIFTPDNATIYIDNEKVGVGYASKSVSIGAEHKYKVVCEDYITEENTITFTRSEKKELNVELRPDFGYITVKSTPTGAEVYVDKKKVGVTPYQVEKIKRGQHVLEVRNDGYESFADMITIKAGEVNKQFENVTLVAVKVSNTTVAQQPVVEQTKNKDNVSTTKALPNTINGHEYVDLGLSSGTLWATCNVGANKPEDCGNYYAWGETKTKNIYDWSTYKYCSGKYDNLTKYNSCHSLGIVDNRKKLENGDDAAHTIWGSSWRMPTEDEIGELKVKCRWVWTTKGGRFGCCVTGPNGKSIFLPAAGCRDNGNLNDVGHSGSYWSSSLDTDYCPNHSWCLLFIPDYIDVIPENYCLGLSIRPVSSKLNIQ